MLFNSVVFLFAFLPIVYLIGLVLSKVLPSALVFWLGAASLAFYMWWSVHDTIVLGVSILGNYAIGSYILSEQRSTQRFLAVAAGIAVNLSVLGYYKYAGFFCQNIGTLINTQLPAVALALPLGISFFTFTQIAFLVDCQKNKVSHNNFFDYFLFVSYFPHLIAGPIIHHNKIIPQFAQMHKKFGCGKYFSVGLTIFIIGLFKKVILADSIAPYADRVFDQVGPHAITFFEAWGGALAYTLQIYLDFSAYSDMAIGISYMLGVRLPLNFYSPYKARNIIDFWRRWHISLSCFLRDYLYIPLGGNRLGRVRRHANLMITMLLGGLWHGANWTFVVWGGLHGLFLVVNHMFQSGVKGTVVERALLTRAGHACSIAFTFFLVVVAWVYFRAADMAAANGVIQGMFGFNGFQVPDRWMSHFGNLSAILGSVGIETVPMDTYFGTKAQLAWTAALIAGVFWLPNTFDIMHRYAPATLDEHAPQRTVVAREWTEWRPNIAWLSIIGALGIAALWALFFSSESKFIYFNF